MYKFDRIENCNFKMIGSKTTGTIAFMCPHCFNVEYFEGEVGILLKPKRKLNSRDVYDFLLPNISISYRCSKCEEPDNQIFLDPNIAATISILNKKGWTTEFSCEGHEEAYYTSRGKKQAVENPYILFSANVYKELQNMLKECPLPKTWYIDANDCCVEDGRIAIRSKRNRESRIDDITIWADTLPKNKQYHHKFSVSVNIPEKISLLNTILETDINCPVSLNDSSLIRHRVLDVIEWGKSFINDKDDMEKINMINMDENENINIMNTIFDLLYQYNLCMYHVNYNYDSTTGMKYLKLVNTNKDSNYNLPDANNIANIKTSDSITT